MLIACMRLKIYNLLFKYILPKYLLEDYE